MLTPRAPTKKIIRDESGLQEKTMTDLDI
jgi:hypothetical protein